MKFKDSIIIKIHLKRVLHFLQNVYYVLEFTDWRI